MSDDKREKILVRLTEILDKIEEFNHRVYRNRGEVTDDLKPCAVVLDGRIAIRVSTVGKGREMPATPFYLYPQIFVILKQRSGVANLKLGDVDAPIGPEISHYQNKVLRAILFDTRLQGLLGNNGEIEVRGVDTDMQTGSFMEGTIQFDIAFTYTFNPNDL